MSNKEKNSKQLFASAICQIIRSAGSLVKKINEENDADLGFVCGISFTDDSGKTKTLTAFSGNADSVRDSIYAIITEKEVEYLWNPVLRRVFSNMMAEYVDRKTDEGVNDILDGTGIVTSGE